jgi:erythrocyte band 7 integral membrane protein
MKVVQEYQRAVIFRLGRILTGGAKGPGLFFILPCIDNLVIVDLRTITFDVPPQEILTKDSVTVTVDAVVYFRIFDPVASVINVENAQYSTRLLAATTLRNILGTKTLQEVLQDRESLAHHMQVRLLLSYIACLCGYFLFKLLICLFVFLANKRKFWTMQLVSFVKLFFTI